MYESVAVVVVVVYYSIYVKTACGAAAGDVGVKQQQLALPAVSAAAAAAR